VNDEFRLTWKETVVALLKVLSRHLIGVTEEIHENLRIFGSPTEIRTGHLPMASEEVSLLEAVCSVTE
jgi:hypothetical protein